MRKGEVESIWIGRKGGDREGRVRIGKGVEGRGKGGRG